MAGDKTPHLAANAPKLANGIAAPSGELVQPRRDVTCYEPAKIFFEQTYGGLEVDVFFGFKQTASLTEDLIRLKPTVPELHEMGVVDIRAITLSLQSGIRREVRYALDVLQKLSWWSIDLTYCEDLVDVLVDCGEQQVEMLAEDAAEVSDAIDLASYEDVIRHARVEIEWSLQEHPEVGTNAYNLDRAAERVIAVTRILRNLATPPPTPSGGMIHVPPDYNAPFLADASVIKFLSNAIRLLGTRNMLLRSHWNTQEFMKDVAHILTYVAAKIKLPSQEDALNLLHFLLAFAPTPDPSSSRELRFPSYDARRHKYYYFAVDSLAKLMLEDDPNRGYFKAIFAEASSPSIVDEPSSTTATEPAIHQTYSLVTRAFGLAIAILPDRSSLLLPDEQLVHYREAALSQGLLAADIICGLLPQSAAAALARAWLGSHDSWVPCMLNLCRSLFNDPNIRAHDGWRSVMSRAFGMLRELATIALGKQAPKHTSRQTDVVTFEAPASPAANGDGEDDSMMVEGNGSMRKTKSNKRNGRGETTWDGIIAELLPNWSFVMGALNMNQMDTNILRHLVALASLEE
jgi:SWI/SNF chromatin-remodeling complex subunit SWI1